MSSIAYLRSAYGIPAKKGMRVKLKKAYFNIPSDGGVITGAKHAYLRIRIDGEKHSRFFHPTYGVIYPAVEPTLALDSLKDGGKKPEFVIFDDVHDNFYSWLKNLAVLGWRR